MVGVTQNQGRMVVADVMANADRQLVVDVSEKVGDYARHWSGAGFKVVVIPATPAQAAAVRAAMGGLQQSVAGQTWQLLGPNCTTPLAGLLEAGGVTLPAGAAMTPATLYVAVQYPLLARTVASGVSSTVTGTGAALLYTPGPPPDQRR